MSHHHDDPLWTPGLSHDDAELADLEAALGSMRYHGTLPELPERTRAVPAPVPWRGLAIGVAAAAAALLLAPSTPQVAPPPAAPRLVEAAPTGTAWEVSTLAGPELCADEPCRLDPGAWLETGPETTALVIVADIGWMEVGPDSRLRLVATAPDRHHLELASGQVDAVVDAPPEVLVVDTPAARAVDLGCAYHLEVDDLGEGALTVQAGLVALVRAGEEVVVPAGATAPIRVPGGPGIPRQTDASPDLVAALDRFDLERSADAAAAVAALVRPEDAVSVFWAWARAPEAAQGPLRTWLDALARQGPPPRPFLQDDWTPHSPVLQRRLDQTHWLD